MKDNELANEYWEYKLPKSFKRPTENSSPSEVWMFIQNKYVQRMYAPKKAVDPANDFRENGNEAMGKKKPRTPPTDDDSVKKAVVHKQKKSEKTVENPVQKPNINDLLDIDIGTKSETSAPLTDRVKVDSLWDIMEAKPVPKPTAMPINTKVNITFIPTDYYTKQQARKYDAFDQAAWCPLTQRKNPSTNYFNSTQIYTTPKLTTEAKKQEGNKLDNAFANLLPVLLLS